MPVPPDAEPESSVERRETADRRLDEALAELCELHLSKCNEGNNGIILKPRMEQFPPQLLETLAENGIELDDNRVAKVLKVYTEGKGRHEFAMQQKAYDLVESQPDKEKFASVPKPHFFRDFPINEELRKKLALMTGKPYAGERVEMFLMDLVDGDDMATVLYKEVARRHPKTLDIASTVDDMTFDDLHDRVAMALDFKLPGGKSRDAGEREMESRKVLDENAAKIDQFLSRKGFEMDERVPQQIENTMTLFHENGIAFRDGHHRNFMVAGEYEKNAGGDAPRVFVIDYGAATETHGKPMDEVFHEVSGDGKNSVVKRFPDDFAVARQLRKFVPGQEGREKAALKASRERNPRIRERIDTVLARAGDGAIDLGVEYAAVVGPGAPREGNVELFLSTLAALTEEMPELDAEVKRFLKEKSAQTSVPWLKNRLLRHLRE